MTPTIPEGKHKKLEARLSQRWRLLWSDFQPEGKRQRNYKLWRSPSHVVLIVLDGTTPDLLDKAEIPVIDWLAGRGAVAEHCQAIFPSITGPGHIAICTGALPKTSGLVPFDYSHYLAQGDRANKSETLAELCNRFGLKTCAIGENAARGASIRVSELRCGYDMEKTTRLARWALRKEKPSLLNVGYYLDDLIEYYGPDSPEATDAVEAVDDQIGEIVNLMDRMSILEDALIVITADHGMVTVEKVLTETHLAQTLKRLPVSFSYHRRLAQLNYGKTEIEAEIASSLVGLEGIDFLFTEPEFVVLGLANTEIGDMVLTLKEKYSKSNELPGSHGGYTPRELRVPLILSGAGVKTGTRLTFCRTIDIAPTVAFLLGTSLPSADGRILLECLDGEFDIECVNHAIRLKAQETEFIERCRKTKWALGANRVAEREYYEAQGQYLREGLRIEAANRAFQRAVSTEAFGV